MSSQSSSKRILVKLIYLEDWPTDYPKKREIYAYVTRRFQQAFNLEEVRNLTPIKKTLTSSTSGGSGGSGSTSGGSSGSGSGSGTQTQTRNRYVIISRGSKFAKSFKFWKEDANGNRKGYYAPCGSAPLFAVLKASRSLPGCVGVTTPQGVSYFFGQPGSARQQSGGSGSTGTGGN